MSVNCKQSFSYDSINAQVLSEAARTAATKTCVGRRVSCSKLSNTDSSRSAPSPSLQEANRFEQPWLVMASSVTDNLIIIILNFNDLWRVFNGFVLQVEVFENFGGLVLANACGPCIGQWKRYEI